MKKKIVLIALLAGLGFSNANSQTVPNFTKNAEGSGMYMEENFSLPGLGDLKGYNLIGFNARDEKIHWFTVDNFGTTHEHIGYWVTDDHFFMSVTEKHDGKKFEELIDLVFIDNDHVSIHMIGKLANTTFQELTGTFERMPN